NTRQKYNDNGKTDRQSVRTCWRNGSTFRSLSVLAFRGLFIRRSPPCFFAPLRAPHLPLIHAWPRLVGQSVRQQYHWTGESPFPALLLISGNPKTRVSSSSVLWYLINCLHYTMRMATGLDATTFQRQLE